MVVVRKRRRRRAVAVAPAVLLAAAVGSTFLNAKLHRRFEQQLEHQHRTTRTRHPSTGFTALQQPPNRGAGKGEGTGGRPAREGGVGGGVGDGARQHPPKQGETNGNARNVTSSSDGDPVLEFLLSRGGYYNPKQELRHEDPGNASSLFGVFCKRDIQKGELLAYVPPRAILKTAARRERRFEDCVTAKRLASELRKGNASAEYGPYMASLLRTARDHEGLLPADWSPEGKALLRRVVGAGDGGRGGGDDEDKAQRLLPPRDPFLEDFRWRHECERQLIDDGNDVAIAKAAVRLIMTHGESIGMVPVTDRYNSRGGKYEGAYFSQAGRDRGLKIRARRDLRRGEQVYTDYRDYGQVGTPELLRDYGFVESYPQRWIFHSKRLAFDLEEKEEEGGGLRVVWLGLIRGTKYQNKSRRVRSLQKPLAQLKKLYPDLVKNTEAPKRERDTVTSFCRSMIVAMEYAINSTAAAVSK